MLSPTLQARLRASALYHVLLLLLALATLRAGLLAAPLLAAVDETQRAAEQANSDTYHASWLGAAHGAELDRLENLTPTPAQDLAWQRASDVHHRYEQARRAGYLGVVPVALWGALLVLAASSYLSRGATQVLTQTAGLLVVVALGLAYAPEIRDALGNGVQWLRQLLSGPAYPLGCWVAIGSLLALAAGYDWRRRARRPAAAPVAQPMRQLNIGC